MGKSKPERTHRRKTSLRGKVVALSISDDDENLLAHGFGPEHLRELLINLCRPLLRHEVDLMYGGHFGRDSFTREMIRMIGAEQEERYNAGVITGGEAEHWIGRLYNFTAWPDDEAVGRAEEASWIDCCQIVRVTQKVAGLSDAAIVPYPGRGISSPRLLFNQAVVLTAMRRLMAEGIEVLKTDGERSTIRAAARVIVAGKTRNFKGVLPGLYEEALFALRESPESQRHGPLYILGGFGGAAGAIADYLEADAGAVPETFTLEYFRRSAPTYHAMEEGFNLFAKDLPEGAHTPEAALAEFRQKLDYGRRDLAGLLDNGLNSEKNMLLLRTTDRAEAIGLVLEGLSGFAARHDQKVT
jgi:hypothetical protein